MKITTFMAYSTMALGVISLLSLLTLHFVSTEFKPNFRMISEYALGNYKWMLTLFFICWGLCSILSGCILWNEVTTFWSKLGVTLVFVTGVGAIMGGLFDVQHKLHGLSFGIGVPFLPIGALLITYHLIHKAKWQQYSIPLLVSSHAIWVSLVLMALSMFLLFSSLKSAGIPYGPDAAPLSVLPKGVIGINGCANRLLVVCYLFYPLLLSKLLVTIMDQKQ